MEKPKIVLSDEDREALIKLYHEAQTTPVIYTGPPGSGSWADNAWDRVRDKMKELGEKYGYDPQKLKINQKTGEVIPL